MTYLKLKQGWQCSAAVVVAILGGAGLSAQAAEGIRGVLAPGVVPELVQDGFTLTEGPVGAADGSLYFSERGGDGRTYHLGLDGKVSMVREHTQVANGLAYAPNGDLLLVEETTLRVGKLDVSGTVTTLTDRYQGQPFMMPNDLIVDQRGGVYFTDPGKRPVVPGRPTYVFYLPPGQNEPIVIDGQVPRPNGITLSPDGKTLYADDTLGTAVFAYDVQADGTVKNKRIWATLRNVPEGKESGADGMAIDSKGNVYIATTYGVQVFNDVGAYLGAIDVPRFVPVNLAFAGPDKRTLYITARQALYRVQMLVSGPKRLGK